MYRGYIMVCSGPNCGRTSGRLADEFDVQIKMAGLRKEIQVIRGGCLGLCGSGPNVIIFPEGTIYSHVQNEDAARIVSEHLLKGGRVEDLLYDENQATGAVRCLEETDFFQKQTRIALRNCGVIDPQSIEEYIARDGYAALYKALTEMTPDGVIETVLNSGLRGRALLTYQIDPVKCRGCTACARACTAGAIMGSVKNPHKIDNEKYIKCGSRIEKCRFDAVSRT